MDMCNTASPSVNNDLELSLPAVDHEDHGDQRRVLSVSEERSILRQFATKLTKQTDSDLDSSCLYCG